MYICETKNETTTKTLKTKTMTTYIFKNEKKAKVYQIVSTKNQGCYSENEIVRIVKTDIVSEIVNNFQYKVIAVEVN